MKSKILIAVLVVILIIAIIVALIIKNNSKNNISDRGNSITQNDKNWDDGYVPNIPKEYTALDKANITSDGVMVAQAVAYYYDAENNRTHVKIYVQNRSDKSFSKDSVCSISLYDVNGQLYKFGGVIEEGRDIASGGHTIVSSQFVGQSKDLIRAEISFKDAESPVVTAPIVEENSEA